MSIATLSTTNPSRIGVELNPGLGGARPANSRIYPDIQGHILFRSCMLKIEFNDGLSVLPARC